jgi:hypothetical protein
VIINVLDNSTGVFAGQRASHNHANASVKAILFTTLSLEPTPASMNRWYVWLIVVTTAATPGEGKMEHVCAISCLVRFIATTSSVQLG